MPEPTDLREQIRTALAAFGARPLLDAALGLFAALGYRSERRMKVRSSVCRVFSARLIARRRYLPIAPCSPTGSPSSFSSRSPMRR